MRLLNGIGLGTFPLANPFTFIDEKKAEKIVESFLEHGGQYIDTAPTYAFGEVERFLGRILKNFPRSRFFINTSCGYVLEDGQFKISGRYKDVIEDCEGSLERLGVDVIDLYISHIPDVNTPFEETICAMLDLAKQGKIKNIGVSNVSLEQLKEYNKYNCVKYVQNRFSLINQNFSPDFKNYCIENGIGIIAYQVIERGILTNKILNRIKLRDGDLRNRKPEFESEVVTRLGKWIEEYLKPIAEGLNISISTLVIWWAMQQPYISLCQCGATDEAHVKLNMHSLTLMPSAGVLSRVNEAYNTLVVEIEKEYSKTVRGFMGLEEYNLYSGSASGKV